MIIPFTATSCFTMQCADTQTGVSVTRCYTASSIISQADADKRAEAAAQQTAYAALQCQFPPAPEQVIFYSLPLSGSRVCPTCSGSASISVSVPAAAFFSFESQAAADAAAIALLAARESALVCSPRFYNIEQSYTAYCSAGSTGSSSSATSAAGAFCSQVSVEAANAAALAAATASAIAGLSCVTTYANEAIYASKNCDTSSPDPTKLKGPLINAYVPPGTYFSTVSQSAANGLAAAAAEIAAAAQLTCFTYANLQQESHNEATPDCAAVYGPDYVGGSGSVVIVGADLYFSDVSQEAADALAQAAADAEYAANLNCQYVAGTE